MNLNETERLKEFKEKSGWSYVKISNLMGIAVQSVTNWIKGNHKPSSMAREKIRQFLADYSFKG